MSETPMNPTELRTQAAGLRLHGLLAHWPEVMADADAARRVTQWLRWEAEERGRRSLERRLREAHIGQFKPIADFDWSWPRQVDRAAIEELMTLQFMADATNVVLVGGNGLGKTMCACNLGYQAILAGRTALFVTAGHLLGDLAALDSDSTLRRRLRHYAAPDLLLIDEVGYLSYSNRHADLLFELVSRRYQHKSTVVTTNKAFADWGEVFPNAACVVSLVDRLMHRAEVVRIEGESYRAKEAHERLAARARQRSARQTSPKTARELRTWLQLERRRVAGNAIGQAIDYYYTLNGWDALTLHLSDGRVPIDNNHIEQQIKPWKLGAKNWLFLGSEMAGQRAAIVMSLVQSAKLNRLDPWAYLRDVLARIHCHPASRIDELLPHCWQPR